uniref:Uncharacterized protein n=1 Tax=Trichogramma kaykai TaxID=54128 RepID=A0ABD2WL30_9HYME
MYKFLFSRARISRAKKKNKKTAQRNYLRKANGRVVVGAARSSCITRADDESIDLLYVAACCTPCGRKKKKLLRYFSATSTTVWHAKYPFCPAHYFRRKV